MPKIYKTIIVDDHPMVLSGIRAMLENAENIEIAGEFESGEALLKGRAADGADLVIVDIFLPGISGIDLCRAIKMNHPEKIIIGMSSQSERSLAMQFIQSGGNGYILKSVASEEFKRCIDKAIEGEIVFSEEVKKIIGQPQKEDLAEIPVLSRREKDIMSLLIEGKSTQEIADFLFLSFLTVQTHRRNILQKYKMKNAVELIA
ncbi:MAG TPA: response regulator transcription factor, partial [Flavobacterium sp.]|nr:response regulator transcription factor [Flavobacterium sp.]